MALRGPWWIQCSNVNCGSNRGFREDLRTGDIVCTLCGRVAQQKILDVGSEWRSFGEEGDGDKVRAEKVDDTSDETLTVISSKQQERNNDSISKIQKQMVGSEQKAMSLASGKISEFGERMNLPQTVLKSAKRIYKEFETAKKKRKVRGSNTDEFIIAVLYIACKENGVSRTFKELARDTDITDMAVRRMYQRLTKHLGSNARTHAPLAPHDLVIRFCSLLNLPHSITSSAQQIAKNGAPRLEGKAPTSIAAASILMAVKYGKVTVQCTEREIAIAAATTPSTVKNISKEMELMKDDLLKQEP
jgi:transcription initiation factor TFIIB